MKGRRREPVVPVSVAEEWEQFRAQCLNNSSPLAMNEARALFYAGCRATLFNMVEAANGPEGSARSLFDRWNAELEAYGDEVRISGELPK